MSIDGLTLNFSFPNTANASADVVVGVGTEYSNSGGAIDISGFALNYSDIDPPWGSTPRQFVISDKFSVLPDITSVTFVANQGQWAESRVTFDANSLSIDVTNMNPPFSGLQFVLKIGFSPTDIALAAGTVLENDKGATIGTLSNNDFDGSTTLYEIVDSKGNSIVSNDFVIVGDQLQLAANASLDFETNPNVSLYVRATDGDGRSWFEEVTFNVTDANDTPNGVQLSTNVVAENDAAGPVIGTLSTSDQDPGDTFTYEIVDSAGNPLPTSDFFISGDQLKLKPGVSLDYETTPTVTVYVKTTDGLASYVQPLKINVANVNEKPTDIILSANSVVENNTSGVSIGSLATIDGDLLDKFGYSIVDSNGNPLPTSSFEIGIGGDLRLKAGVALDFEAGSTVKLFVKTTDGLGESFVKEFTVNVTDDPSDNSPPAPVNTAPTLATPNADAAAQAGAMLSLTIGDGHFVDPQGTDLNYSITVDGGAMPSWMTFNTATGAFTATATTSEVGQHVVIVTASDGSLSTSDTFNVIVTNPIAPGDPKGTKGDDTLVGGSGDNIMDGRKGDDKLTGGDGADTFVLGKNYGHDKVLDFDPDEGDMIDLTNAVGIRSFNDLMAHHINDTDAGLKIIAADGSSLFLKGIDAGDLTSDMFVF